MSLRQNHRQWVVGISLVITGGLLFVFWKSITIRDLQITVANVGDMEFSTVTVHVTDAEYALGGLLPGREKTVVASPRIESRIHLTLVDITGSEQTMDASVDLKPGDVGTVEIEVNRAGIVRIKNGLKNQRENF